MTPELIITLTVMTIVAINQFILSKRTDILNLRMVSVEAAVRSTRRQIVRNREMVPDPRPTRRNRELTKLGRDIDAEVPVTDDLEIVNGDDFGMANGG